MTPRYTIAALVPEPFASQLAAMRRKYDIYTRQWLPPHITILPPFEYDLTRDDIDIIREFPVNVSATFDGWAAFRRSLTSVLFLKLRDHAFPELLEGVLRTLPQLGQFRPRDFDGHVTVVSRIPNDAFSQVESTVSKESVEGTFSVDRLMLYRWDDELRRWIAVTM